MAKDLTRRGFLGTAGTVMAAGTAATAAGAADGETGGRVKIVGICCSPRQGMTTFESLQVCLDAARETSSRIAVELIELAGKKIEGSVAAGVPLDPGQQDDFPPLVPKLAATDVGGIVVATPVYFANMSSLCKAFLERCIAFRKRDFALGGKVAGVLAVGGSRNGGQELTIRSVQTALMCQEMIIVGEARPSAHMGGTVWSGTPGGVTEDEFGMQSIGPSAATSHRSPCGWPNSTDSRRPCKEAWTGVMICLALALTPDQLLLGIWLASDGATSWPLADPVQFLRYDPMAL